MMTRERITSDLLRRFNSEVYVGRKVLVKVGLVISDGGLTLREEVGIESR